MLTPIPRTANLGCDLVGTTEATCSGYSSHRPPEFNMGKGVVSTRPDELSWTSTLTGSAVQWGTLTLADVPATATDGSGSDGSATGSPTAATSNIFYYTPQPASGGDMVRPGAWLMAGLVVLVLGI